MTREKLLAQLNERVYLGDGLYASHDGFQFRLAASDGVRDHNVVFLDPHVTRQFMEYVNRVTTLMKEHLDEEDSEKGTGETTER